MPVIMASGKYYTVIPFKGSPERRITLLKNKGIRAGRKGTIIVFKNIFHGKGKKKIHIPTELAGAGEDGSQFLLLHIDGKGVKGKLTPYGNIPDIFILSQILIDLNSFQRFLWKRSQMSKETPT